MLLKQSRPVVRWLRAVEMEEVWNCMRIYESRPFSCWKYIINGCCQPASRVGGLWGFAVSNARACVWYCTCVCVRRVCDHTAHWFINFLAPSHVWALVFFGGIVLWMVIIRTTCTFLWSVAYRKGVQPPPPPEIPKFCQSWAEFRGIYVRNNLIRIWVSFIWKLSGTPD
jgi:hypothetical protein